MLLRIGEASIGLTICEDVWQPGPPATDLALAGAQLIVNLSASPFHVGKAEEREEMLVTRARDTSSFFAFCNLVGGQDELVFDGHSVVLDDAGEVVARAPGFEEELLVVDVEPDRRDRRGACATRGDASSIARASRSRRSRSSSSTRASTSRTSSPATIVAVRARARADALGARARPPRLRREERLRRGRPRRLGRDRLGRDRRARASRRSAPERVHCVSMPSRFSSEDTRSDARLRRREPRLRVPRDPDRVGRRRVPRTRSRRRSTAGSRASPRRTCRRASAACS